MTETHAYVRVSTERQEDSLERQQAKLAAYCALRGLPEPVLYIDEDTSARLVPMADRDAGARMLERIGQCPPGVHVLALRLDRLFRNLVDGLQTLYDWEKRDVALHLVDQDGLSISTQTTMGWLLVVDLLKYAELEARLISERTRKGMARRREQGLATSHAPYGQRIGPGGVLEDDSDEQDLLRFVADAREQGYSWRNVEDLVNAEGFRTRSGALWTFSALRKHHTAQS